MTLPIQTPAYWDSNVGSYVQSAEPFTAMFCRDALALAGIGPGLTLLDVATGPGALAIAAAQAGADVTAIDFSQAMIDQLAMQIGALPIEAMQMDGQALDHEGLAEQRAYAGYTLHGTSPKERIVGRVVAKGLGSDELGERMDLTIDGVDGRVHHLEVPAAKVEDIRRGSIITVDPPPSTPRVADANILQQTDANGIYRPSRHLVSVRETMPRIDHERHVNAHVRRLEALRRAGIVERLDADRWTVPADLPERGLAHDRQEFGKGPRIETLSDLPLDRQVRHEGATWLDRTMIGGGRETMPHTGFGGDVRTAWEARKRALADMGYAEDRGHGQFRAPSDLIAQLERADISRVGKALAAERGSTWQPSAPGEYVSGKLVGSTEIASGRFAMIDNGLGFQLVPWSDPLEKRLGQHISGVAMSGGGVDWSFGRKRGLGL